MPPPTTTMLRPLESLLLLDVFALIIVRERRDDVDEEENAEMRGTANANRPHRIISLMLWKVASLKLLDPKSKVCPNLGYHKLKFSQILTRGV